MVFNVGESVEEAPQESATTKYCKIFQKGDNIASKASVSYKVYNIAKRGFQT